MAEKQRCLRSSGVPRQSGALLIAAALFLELGSRLFLKIHVVLSLVGIVAGF
jgi:hypothetical protein